MKRYQTGNKNQLILFSQSVEERLEPDDEVFGFECIIVLQFILESALESAQYLSIPSPGFRFQ